jgi:hypothetical protein
MTHACGYEHPTQMTMKDVDISCGDNNRTISAFEAYGYENTQTDFEGLDKIHNCPYIGEIKENI